MFFYPCSGRLKLSLKEAWQNPRNQVCVWEGAGVGEDRRQGFQKARTSSISPGLSFHMRFLRFQLLKMWLVTG